VGLVWAGNARRETQNVSLIHIDVRRSIALQQLSPLTQVKNVVFYSLQKGEPAAEAKQSPNGMRLIDHTDYIDDFSDTAAFIMNLDLVISVDTSVVHLAGALGKPVWILNRFDTCWRWMLDRDDSPWYPTARLFRQPAPGDWVSVVERVRTELQQLNKQVPRSAQTHT
jgi:hypothetical protein